MLDPAAASESSLRNHRRRGWTIARGGALAGSLSKARARSGYVGAGTLEFLLDQEQNFYFLEMNTRLQVEHAVTERVVGIDLVKAQIEVAAGGYLPWRQRHITQTGHAIECRIYAEDPERDFMPCPGKIEGLRLPEGLGLRNDCGVYEGAEVPIYYDPMIAKLITWGENRVEAILRMRRALREYQVRGIKTNISFQPVDLAPPALHVRRRQYRLHRRGIPRARIAKKCCRTKKSRLLPRRSRRSIANRNRLWDF